MREFVQKFLLPLSRQVHKRVESALLRNCRRAHLGVHVVKSRAGALAATTALDEIVLIVIRVPFDSALLRVPPSLLVFSRPGHGGGFHVEQSSLGAALASSRHVLHVPTGAVIHTRLGDDIQHCGADTRVRAGEQRQQ